MRLIVNLTRYYKKKFNLFIKILANREKDISKANIAIFRAHSGLNNGISDNQMMSNLKLISNEGYIKNGTLLFFGNQTKHFFEMAVIRCVLFRGVDKRYIIDDKEMNGSLYQQFKESIDWLKTKLNVKYEIESEGSGARKEILEIPEIAFKEIIINSLSHRDYYDKGGRITIEVFDDRVEISNPGGLISVIPKNEFGKRSASRNPLIFGLFARMRLVEQIGSGITRIREVMKDQSLLSPEFSVDGMFTVTLRRPVHFEKWVENWSEKLTKNRLNLLHEIHLNPKITKKELEQKLNLSASAIDNNIEFLKFLELLFREGSDKGGYWRINYKTSKTG